MPSIHIKCLCLHHPTTCHLSECVIFGVGTRFSLLVKVKGSMENPPKCRHPVRMASNCTCTLYVAFVGFPFTKLLQLCRLGPVQMGDLSCSVIRFTLGTCVTCARPKSPGFRKWTRPSPNQKPWAIEVEPSLPAGNRQPKESHEKPRQGRASATGKAPERKPFRVFFVHGDICCNMQERHQPLLTAIKCPNMFGCKRLTGHCLLAASFMVPRCHVPAFFNLNWTVSGDKT